MEQLKEIAAYVSSHVESYEDRLRLALDKMDKMRCSLRFTDFELFEDIVNAVEEWCDDNEVSIDFYEDWDDLIEGDEGLIWETEL